MSLFDRPGAPELGTEEVIARANHAARLLADEVLKAAYEDAERRILADWLDMGTPGARDKLLALEEIRQALTRFVSDGEHAAADRNRR